MQCGDAFDLNWKVLMHSCSVVEVALPKRNALQQHCQPRGEQ